MDMLGTPARVSADHWSTAFPLGNSATSPTFPVPETPPSSSSRCSVKRRIGRDSFRGNEKAPKFAGLFTQR